MQWLKRWLVRWLFGERIEHLESWAADATRYVNAVIEFYGLEGHEIEEPIPDYRPPTRTVLRMRKRK